MNLHQNLSIQLSWKTGTVNTQENVYRWSERLVYIYYTVITAVCDCIEVMWAIVNGLEQRQQFCKHHSCLPQINNSMLYLYIFTLLQYTGFHKQDLSFTWTVINFCTKLAVVLGNARCMTLIPYTAETEWYNIQCNILFLYSWQ